MVIKMAKYIIPAQRVIMNRKDFDGVVSIFRTYNLPTLPEYDSSALIIPESIVELSLDSAGLLTKAEELRHKFKEYALEGPLDPDDLNHEFQGFCTKEGQEIERDYTQEEMNKASGDFRRVCLNRWAGRIGFSEEATDLIWEHLQND